MSAAVLLGQDNSGFCLSHLDREAKPCKNFFQFACGNWIRQSPIPADLSTYRRSTELSERNLIFLREILGAEGKRKFGRSPAEQKIGDAYTACMDVNTIDSKGAGPAGPMLRRILATQEKRDLTPVLARLHQDGAEPFLALSSRQNQKTRAR